jgi:radical SAM protein with 4Fe4S-binding SPASM domain
LSNTLNQLLPCVNLGGGILAEIQTNGVFTEEAREWILDNMNIVWLSFDGTLDVQDKNRPLNPQYADEFGGRTAAQILEDNAKWLNGNKNGRNLEVGARLTVTNENVKRQKEIVDYFYGLGIRNVWTDPLFQSVARVPVCDDADRGELDIDMDKYVEKYIEAYHYAKKKGMFWGSFLAVNFNGESKYHCRACLVKKAPHITTDGYISACDMALSGGDSCHMSPFIVGKYNEETAVFDWDDEKVAALANRNSEEMPHCRRCELKSRCGGYCLGEIVNETGRLDGQVPRVCRATHELWKAVGPELAEETYPLHP